MQAQVVQRQCYGQEVKQLVVYQRFTLLKSPTAITIDLNMPLYMVQRVLQTWDEIGAVVKEPKKLGRAHLMGTEQIQVMFTLLEQRPAIYLDGIQDELGWQYDISVSLATICRMLKRLGMTSKQLSKAALEHCVETRTAFQFLMADETPESLVFTDECSVNLKVVDRLMGWSSWGT
ncbi:hypothetical protein K439DRAFT_1355624 [Ramaria rubella]|nr:hypothetical protein K439DRAFT_1355624 [Ramaria rubella]